MDCKIIAVALLLCAGSAHADLSPRDLDPNLPGFEGVYDSTRNITWMRDIAVTGEQSWDFQTSWAASLMIGPYDGWRLAAPDELGSIFSEWQNASRKEFDTFYPPLPGSDVGYGSHLFRGAKFADFWTNVSNSLGAVDKLLSDIPDEGYGPKSALMSAWAVHDGDIGLAVAAVPEPETYALLLAGLVGVLARRRHTSTAPMSGVDKERVRLLMSF